MAGFIGSFMVGIVSIVLGISNMRGNISSIHFYHRYRVSEADRLPFGKRVGLGTVIIGGAVMVFSALSVAAVYTENQIFLTVGSAILLVGLAVGLGISFHAMIKYNKGIF